MSADIPAVTTPTGAWKNYPNTTTPITAEELNERDVALRAIIEALNTGDVPDGFTASGSAVDTVIAEAIAALPPAVTTEQVDSAIAVEGEVEIETVSGGENARALGLAYGSAVFPIPWSGATYTLSPTIPVLHGIT